MGYHVDIVNTTKIADSEKILFSVEKMSRKLNDFGFFEYEREKENIHFAHHKNDEFVLFYDNSEPSLWTSTTSDELISIMVQIAESFADGSIVRGDESETYSLSNGTLVQKLDSANENIDYKRGNNKIRLLIFLMFCMIEFIRNRPNFIGDSLNWIRGLF